MDTEPLNALLGVPQYPERAPVGEHAADYLTTVQLPTMIGGTSDGPLCTVDVYWIVDTNVTTVFYFTDSEHMVRVTATKLNAWWYNGYGSPLWINAAIAWAKRRMQSDVDV